MKYVFGCRHILFHYMLTCYEICINMHSDVNSLCVLVCVDMLLSMYQYVFECRCTVVAKSLIPNSNFERNNSRSYSMSPSYMNLDQQKNFYQNSVFEGNKHLQVFCIKIFILSSKFLKNFSEISRSRLI